MRFLQQVLALLAKDLKTEWRTREIFTSMFVFAVLVLVVFNFAIGADTELIRQVASGVIWIALLFASDSTQFSGWEGQAHTDTLPR